MFKSGAALPERLSTRCYVHPYISDPVKPEDDKPSTDDQLSKLEHLNNPSAATLVEPVMVASEVPRVVPAASTSSPQKSYHWPMAPESDFSEATKAKFEKKPAGAQCRPIKKINEDEAPVPRFFTDREDFLQKLESLHRESTNSQGTKFTICCNNCEKAIPDAHWHCGICDMGDFDLCGDCVAKGSLCDNEEHWLIKRFVKDGKVIPSTTETIGPKKPVKAEQEEKVPGAFTSETKREEAQEPLDLSRTCNSCVQGKYHHSPPKIITDFCSFR